MSALRAEGAGGPEVIWEPQPGPQTALLACPVEEVFYGGARGGGKTESSIGDWLAHSGQWGSWARGIFIRRKLIQLEQVIQRTQELFPRLGAKYNEQRKEWRMPGGGILTFRYLERDVDAEGYQGHSYSRVYIEEATNFPTPGPIFKLKATLRNARAPKGMRLTGNPGGPGHNWVKARYITPAPQGYQVLTEEVPGLQGEVLRTERIFIPSRISDNRLLWVNDPLYVARLRQSGSEALVKAWLEGDWDIIDGAFFECWDEALHVLPTQAWLPRIPPHALRFRAFDWGSEKPFCVGWYAVSDGTWGLPKGCLLKYREWYGSDGRPDKGLKMTATDVARGILAREAGEHVTFGVADPAIYIRNGGPSIGEMMAVVGVMWRRADNKRIAGWQQLRERLLPGPNGPMLRFLDCCEASIRTLPILQHDERDPEDVDTEMEDHAGDETRYAAMARPWVQGAPAQPAEYTWPKTPAQMTFNELFKRHQARLRREEAEMGVGEG